MFDISTTPQNWLLTQDSNVHIRINWLDTTEYVPFNLNDLPKPGSSLETIEEWPGETTITYLVRCVSAEKSGDTATLVLRYEKDDNLSCKELLALDLPPWGTSTITLNLETRKAKATYVHDCVEAAHLSGKAGSCAFIDEAQFGAMSYETFQRLARPGQARMREELFRVDGKCAISGETTQAALDAAHIIDHQDSGLADIRNGLLLRTDLHRLFDRQILEIKPTGDLILHDEESLSQDYKDLISKKARLDETLVKRIASNLLERARLKG